MSKTIKKYGIIIVMFGIEGYFFYEKMTGGNMDFEMFFFTWAALWFAIFFFSIKSSRGIGGGLDYRKSSDIGYVMTTNSSSYAKEPRKSDQERASILSLEFMYLAMFFVNVIAYIIYVNIAF